MAARRCSVCHRTGHDKRRHAGRRQSNPKAMFIRFSVDKNGKRRAWKSYGGSQYLREFPIAVDEAEMLIATGQATVSGGGKLRAVNPAGIHRMPRAVALAEIRAEVAKHGQATQHAIRVYTENRISRDAFNAAVRAGLAQRARNPATRTARIVSTPSGVFILYQLDGSPDGSERASSLAAARQAMRHGWVKRGASYVYDPERNPDFFRDRFGRPHPVRGTPGYEDAFVGMSRADKRYLRSGSDQPRGGYTHEAQGRLLRVTAEKRRSTAKRDTSAGERLARGRTAAQKQADANRRYRVMGA
jgi:hypothetical protein